MRIRFTTTDTLKATAKLLVREAGSVGLAASQAAIAKAMGYRDWHDLHGSCATEPSERTPGVTDWRDIILSVSGSLGVAAGDVQHALMRARVIPDLPLEDILAIRAAIWRKALFGPPARGKPGTVVRVDAPGEKRHAYLLHMGRPASLFYDTGFGGCADFEVVTPRLPLPDFVPSRLWLPYGFCTLEDGSIVTFSRDYKPMWRTTQGVTARTDPWLWINGIRGETHFSTISGTVIWSRGAARELALQHLRDLRIVGVPRLLDAMEHSLAPGVDSVNQAVDLMKKERSDLAA